MIPVGEKLGEGGEAEVFALGGDRVLRRFREPGADVSARADLMAEIAGAANEIGLQVPELLDTTTDDQGRPCFVERRLTGIDMTTALTTVAGPQRRRLVCDYLDTAHRLRFLPLRRPWFGELIADDPLRAPTWTGYLSAALDRQAGSPDAAARDAIADLDGTLSTLEADLEALPEPEPSIVHFDYFPGNVLCAQDRITAVIDWSVLSIIGDPDLDVALAVAYLGVTPTVTAPDWTTALTWLDDHGLRETARTYARFGAAWWLPVTEDAQIRPWVVRALSGGLPVTARRAGGTERRAMGTDRDRWARIDGDERSTRGTT